MKRCILSMIAALAGVSNLAVAQTAPSPVAPDVVSDIVVRGVTDGAVSAYVDGLLEPARFGRFDGQIARWRDPVCIRVIGAAPEANRALEAKIKAVVTDLGGVLGSPRCSPTAMVVVAAEAERFATVFANRYRVRFFNRGRAEITDFTESPAGVRWRHRTRTAGAAAPVNDALLRIGQAPQVRATGSRLRLSTAEIIDRAMVIVDPALVDDISSSALAEYLAFVILVDLPPGVDGKGVETILNLFEDPSARLTDWDRAFVWSLYHSHSDQVFTSQAFQIRHLMRRHLEGDAGPGAF